MLTWEGEEQLPQLGGEQDEEWRPQRHLSGSDQATWGPLWGNVLQLHVGEDHCQVGSFLVAWEGGKVLVQEGRSVGGLLDSHVSPGE